MRTIDNTMGDRSSAGVSGPVTRGSIIARLERLPGNAMQVRARILIGLATFFDGFDVIAIAATLPILIQKWGLTPWEIGFLIASGSIGQLIGAFVFPWYAERKGRVTCDCAELGDHRRDEYCVRVRADVYRVRRIADHSGLGPRR